MKDVLPVLITDLRQRTDRYSVSSLHYKAASLMNIMFRGLDYFPDKSAVKKGK